MQCNGNLITNRSKITREVGKYYIETDDQHKRIIHNVGSGTEVIIISNNFESK